MLFGKAGGEKELEHSIMRVLCILEDESENSYLIDLGNSGSFWPSAFSFLPVKGCRCRPGGFLDQRKHDYFLDEQGPIQIE